MTEVTRKQISDTLSKIDVSPFLDTIKGKGNFSLSYLPWSAAVSIMNKSFPNWSYGFKQFMPDTVIKKNPDGSEIIRKPHNTQDYVIDSTGCHMECIVTICGHKYHSSLYVMDTRNNAIRDPKLIDQANINKTKMRCIVKTLAFAGLGTSVFLDGDGAPIDQKLTKAGITPDKIIEQRDQAQLMRDRQRFNQVVNTVTEGDKDAKQKLIAQVTAKVKEMLKQQEHPVAMAMLTELERGQWYLKGLNQVLLEQDK